jgi:hypothetical protein
LNVDTTQPHPSISDILADLKGFGIEDLDQWIPLTCGAVTVNIKMSNLPPEQESLALLAVEEMRGYAMLQEVKAELISRAISGINGVRIASLSPKERMVIDPTDGKERDIQVVLRNLINTWGQEYKHVLWKVFLVHCQNIEDRLLKSFPEAAVMTEVERRLTEEAMKKIESEAEAEIVGQISELFNGTENE